MNLFMGFALQLLFYINVTHRGSKLAMVLRDSGFVISFSSTLTMSTKRGRLERSWSQHWSISWYTAEGQSMGAGRRNASLMAFIT